MTFILVACVRLSDAALIALELVKHPRGLIFLLLAPVQSLDPADKSIAIDSAIAFLPLQAATQPASIPADALQLATAASLQQPALQAVKSSSEAAAPAPEPAATAAMGDALPTARSTAKAEGRVKRALDVNAATPRARQAAEQQHPGPSQRAPSSEAPAASESALGNGFTGSAAGVPFSKSTCALRPEGSAHPSDVIAPVFTEVSIPGLADPVQPSAAAADQATASKQPGSASAFSAEKPRAAVESGGGSSPAGAAVEGPAPAVRSDHTAPHVAQQAANTASSALAASGVATCGGLVAAGTSVPMESKNYSQAAAVAEFPSQATAAADMISAEQAVASVRAMADGVSLRSAVLPLQDRMS